MHIINYKPVDSIESNLYRTTARVADGETTFERIMYFESDDPQNEDSLDVISLDVFPKKYAAHPRKPQYKYYENATVEPVDSEGRFYRAVLEYSSTYQSGKDSDGNKITEDTPPWKLNPDNISFTYPEVTIPFEKGFDSTGNATDPVQNSAGDPIPAVKSVGTPQLSFTFATQNWDVTNTLKYASSLNSESVKVCGHPIIEERGLLKPPEATFITVYEDGTDVVKWEYWSVNVTILFDVHGNIFNRCFLDVGDRAKFLDLNFADDLLGDAGVTANAPGTTNPSQICRFRKTQRYTVAGKNSYAPTGDIVFCSWEQYIALRQVYLNASSNLVNNGRLDSLYELQCEQEKSMPLDGNGFIDLNAIQTKDYQEVVFRAFPAKSWNALNLPKKGIK